MNKKIALVGLAIAIILTALSAFVVFADEIPDEPLIYPAPALPGTPPLATIEKVVCKGDKIKIHVAIPERCEYEYRHDVMVTEGGRGGERLAEHYQLYQGCEEEVTREVVVIDTPTGHAEIYVNGVLCDEK
jgi:hypothetical protein